MSDYRYISFDGNFLDQPWVRRLDGLQKDMLVFFWLKCDKIGMWDWSTKIFIDEWDWHEYFDKDMIDIEKFIEACNMDKERFVVTEDNKLWFTPTITWRNGNKGGIRALSASDRDISILEALSMRESTQKWVIKEITSNRAKLRINKETLERAIMNKGHDKLFKTFCVNIGVALDMDVSDIRHPDEVMKSNYDYVCQYCGKTCLKGHLQIDHIIPTSKGGKDKEYNKIPACVKCNASKKDQNVLQFMMKKGFTPTPHLIEKLYGLQSRKQLKGVDSYVDKYAKTPKIGRVVPTLVKRNKKFQKNFLTYPQVCAEVAKDRSLKMGDHFTITDEIGDDGNRLWIRNGQPKKYERTRNAI